MDKTLHQLRRDTPARYRIRVQGVLDPAWSAYFESVTISPPYGAEAADVTVLCGQLADQAALMGVLNNVYDLGYPVLSVVCLDHE